MRWAGHIACTEVTCVLDLFRKSEGKGRLEDISVDGKYYLKRRQRNKTGRCACD